MSDQQPVDIFALSDLATPWCVHVVATLRIANHIADGNSNVADLATAANCDAFALHRVLTYLVQRGVFLEPSDGQFALNDASRMLLHDMVRRSLDLDDMGGRFAGAWGTLLTYVRTGQSGYQEVFGLPFWEDLDAHPAIAASFDDMIGPAGHGMPNPNFDIVGGWESIKTVADVGGGTGAMLAGVLNAYPHLRGILVDQPRTVARSGAIFSKAGVSDRVTISGQSFFDPLPTGADLYWLRGILNDFPDREAAAILTRCAEAAHPDGRVIILGGVVPDGAPRAISIEAVLLGGKHRSVTEFAALAREAGLQVISTDQQAHYFVVECRPI